jgi:hypothetical protein
MDTREILTAVKAEISRLQKVVDLLEDGAMPSPSQPPAAAQVAKSRSRRNAHKWTEAERKAMSLKQKARWAAKKKSKRSSGSV